MPGNSFGHLFRITTAGESHGPANVVIIDGVPPGMALSVEDLLVDLRRRRPGQSRLVTQRDEADEPEILSGVFEGRTTGTSLAILIRNRDQRSRDYDDIKDLYRPGHADYSFDAKYGFRDFRGGGRSSARETNVRVAAGAVAKKLLEHEFGGRVLGYVVQVGTIRANVPDPSAVTLQQVETLPDGQPNLVRCPDYAAAAQMVELIEQMRRQQDSIGGAAEIVATGVPAGLGEPVFDKIKADLAKALFSLPAVLGVEYGIGFGCVTMRGSEHNDIFTTRSLAEVATGDAQSGGSPAASTANAPGAPRSADVPGSAGTGPAGTASPQAAGRAVPSRADFPVRGAPADAPLPDVVTRTNRHGGMLGGITTGMPIVLRAAVKPTSSLPREQPTITRRGEPATIRTRGRHDPCLLPRFVPMAEAMVAIVLADHYLRWKAQCLKQPRK
jgi:chorismate synthase